MAIKTILWPDFVLGELSPRMELKDDFEGRRHGVDELINFVIHPQGSVETACGWNRVDGVNHTWGRSFQFIISPTQSYMVLVTTTTIYFIDGGGVVFSLASPWSTIGQIQQINALMHHTSTIMYLFSNELAPRAITYISAANWTITTPSITAAPAAWTTGNYPNVATRAEGRLWLGGSPNNPSTFWGSKSATYFDFTMGSLADNALEHTLDRRGKIVWMKGAKALLIGTENAEFIITSNGGVIIPGDIKSIIQSSNGSAAVNPIEIGDEVVYVSPDGRKLRAMNYEWDRDAWRSKDLTFNCEHITKGNTIAYVSYSANPDSTIFAVTNTGQGIVFTYDPITKTCGPAHRITQEGSIKDAIHLPSSGYMELWTVVERWGKLSIEHEILGTNTKLDSYKAFTGTNLTSVTVPHLAGKTCQVLVDGAVHPDVVPAVGTGVVTLEYPGDTVIVGLKIPATLKILPIADVVNPTGSTRLMKKHWISAAIKIIESWRPTVSGGLSPDRSLSTPMDTVEPANTEFMVVSLGGWSISGQILITQDIPKPVHIGGLVGRIEQNEV